MVLLHWYCFISILAWMQFWINFKVDLKYSNKGILTLLHRAGGTGGAGGAFAPPVFFGRVYACTPEAVNFSSQLSITLRASRPLPSHRITTSSLERLWAMYSMVRAKRSLSTFCCSLMFVSNACLATFGGNSSADRTNARTSVFFRWNLYPKREDSHIFSNCTLLYSGPALPPTVGRM